MANRYVWRFTGKPASSPGRDVRTWWGRIWVRKIKESASREERLCGRTVRRLPCSWPLRFNGIAVGTWGPTPRYFALWSCPDGHLEEAEVSEATAKSLREAKA